MILGTLMVKTSGQLDKIPIFVENTDANLVNSAIDKASMNDPAHIRGFSNAGVDLSLTDYIQKYKPQEVDIDASDTSQVLFEYEDSGEALKIYDLKIQLIYEEEYTPTYDEAVLKNEAQKLAAEKLAEKKS